MANHLIIGLGGTGGRILCEMRKRIYEEFRSNEPKGQVHIEYLYVDSSPADLDNRSGWKIMGGSVHLMDNQKISIHGMGANVLNNLHQYPGIESFINEQDKELLKDISGLITDGIGGQRRRLGRLLFANNLSGPAESSFSNILLGAVQRLSDASGRNQVTFHVCAGLAGGTGSGSVVDTVTQIRKHFAPQHGIGDQYKINLYLYVPELIVANPSHNAGYYQANGYAALSELNAISVHAYHPYDVSGQARENDGKVKRLLQQCDAFEGAYLFSNINEMGCQLQIGTELPAAVSDFLFQKIVAGEMSNQGQMARLLNCENNGTEPECDGAGNPVHSRRFLTFGIKRVEYPENEVKEYVTYSFARQAARQLQYNLWRDGIGFDECSIAEVGLGYKAEIQEKKTLEALLLSDNYLTLSKALLQNDATRKWNEIAPYWEKVTQFYAQDAEADSNKKNWLSLFTGSCELQFNTNYRGLGVKEFYKVQRSERNGYAAYIRRHIEEMLFNEWHSGTKSILEIEKYTALLIEECEDRIPKFKEKIAQFENYIEQETGPEIRRCNEEWNRIGWLRDAITNASSKIFAAYKTAKCEYYTVQTRIEGYRFAIELIQAVKNELEQMQNQIVAFKSLLTEVTQRVEDQVESKCKAQNDEVKGSGKIVKKYDPNMVREITRNFIMDEQKQKQNAGKIRGEIVALLGEDGRRCFNTLLDKLDVTQTEDLFVRNCLSTAVDMMADLATADPTQKMVNVNILEKIKQEYNSDERLEEFIRGLIKSAKCYLQFNSEEMSKVLPGGHTHMQSMVQLCLPEYDDPTNFRQKFINMFSLLCRDFKPASDLAVNYKQNQIVIVAASSGFPLRFVANVANLKDRYEDMLKGAKSPLNKMVMHTETFAKELPALFEKSIDDKKNDIIPFSLLAYAMDLPKDKSNPVTGEMFKAIEIRDELQIVTDLIDMGRNPVQAVDKLAVNDKNADKLARLVQEKLDCDYLHNDRKKQLQERLASMVNNDLLHIFNNNELDPSYKLYMQEAVTLIHKTLKLV